MGLVCRSLIILLLTKFTLSTWAIDYAKYSNDSTLVKTVKVKELKNLSETQKTAVEKINQCKRTRWSRWNKKNFLVPVSDSAALIYSPLPVWRADLKNNDSIICVSLAKQLFGCYKQGILIYWGPISSGRRGMSTPTGTWSIVGKFRLIISAKYDNAPMPYSLQYNGNYCLHQGLLPGYAASHGCIRLLKLDAKWLYNWAKVGVKLIIE